MLSSQARLERALAQGLRTKMHSANDLSLRIWTNLWLLDLDCLVKPEEGVVLWTFAGRGRCARKGRLLPFEGVDTKCMMLSKAGMQS